HGCDGPATQALALSARARYGAAMTDLSDIKAIARKVAFANRKAAQVAAPDAGAMVRDHLLASRYLTGAQVVTAYRPIRTEINPDPLMEALHAAGHRLAVPVILGEGQPLAFHEWWPGMLMQSGPFGAEIPVDTPALTPDLILAPLLAFDRRGYRLGYGGGFYDRTLEGLRARGRVTAMGLAFAAQEVEEVPIEPTDQRLDAILTERGIIKTEVEA
ncbi:MAG: 5-formyltetrahydrofolate cyclo-ligase, partial [Pseudomonadota bacterium]